MTNYVYSTTTIAKRQTQFHLPSSITSCMSWPFENVLLIFSFDSSMFLGRILVIYSSCFISTNNWNEWPLTEKSHDFYFRSWQTRSNVQTEWYVRQRKTGIRFNEGEYCIGLIFLSFQTNVKFKWFPCGFVQNFIALDSDLFWLSNVIPGKIQTNNLRFIWRL